MTTTTLNPDIFQLVLDVVRGKKGQWQTVSDIFLSRNLRLVNRNANARLKDLPSRHIRIPNTNELIHVMEWGIRGMPNYDDYEVMHIIADKKGYAELYESMFVMLNDCRHLKMLVIDMRSFDVDELEERTRFAQCPNSISQLGFLTSGPIQGMNFFLDSFLGNGPHVKLAICWVPVASIFTRPRALYIQLAMFIDETVEVWNITLFKSFLRQFPAGGWVRIVYGEREDESELPYLREAMAKDDTPPLITIEDLQPHPALGSRLRWFSKHTLDGTIWDVQDSDYPRPIYLYDVL
ncbi:hypothetical protein DACRYDRAFT_112587 [Dacryopinax primogenitus]|uniref:Uncharacterized protein n=1 Tax=Dacryopinax primogenitus (strain DJM 731) TaxID=1858805 RepID=M5FYQ6_DACPD|nr:uncharacterized protein DACRYDRAFT_112587 [Dacryopinax primogenitus]EJT96637.1 hypothetical protein DACRYDRAFT_112587 [Dacryopinax primogenitus]